MNNFKESPARKRLTKLLDSQIVLLDGPMGTMIQSYDLNEQDFRNERFKDWKHDLKGNNEVLSLTRPDVISAIHRLYLEAGADIIETNTFSANSISQQDYSLENVVSDLNKISAEIAKSEAKNFTDFPRFVAGAIGPTNRTASLSPDVNNPGFRNVDFDMLKESYAEQRQSLRNGGEI